MSVLPCSIGYPVVYLGFDATCYFTSIFKMRTQKAVQSENDFHMHLLQQSLPPGLHIYPKSLTDGDGGERTHVHFHTVFFFCFFLAHRNDFHGMTIEYRRLNRLMLSAVWFIYRQYSL